MKLVFLYFDGGLLPEAKQLNFDSNYRCLFKNNVLSVHKEVVLPKNFFSKDAEGDAVVEDVSAIIGKNGSGKTSVARSLGSIVCKDSMMPERFIVLVENGGRLECFARRFDFEIKAEQRIAKYDDKSEHWLSDVFELVYLSPNYTPGNQLGVNITDRLRYGFNKNFVPKVMDLSQGALFTECQIRSGTFSKFSGEIRPEEINPVSACERIILQRIMEFGFVNNDGTEGLYGGISYPLNISISPEETDLIAARIAFADVQQEKGHHPGEIKFFEMLSELLEEDLRSDFFMRCVQCYIAEHCLTTDFDDWAELRKQNMFPFLLVGEGINCVQEWKKGGKHKRKAYLKFIDLVGSKFAPKHYFVDDIKGRRPVLAELFKELLVLHDNAEKLDKLTVHCSMTDKGVKMFARACQLVRLHYMSKGDGEFLRFSFNPPYPAGYMSFLFMWAQLYNFLGRYAAKGHYRHTTETGNLLVFLDEAELSLQPERQRTFVTETIRLLETLDHGVKFHVVFSTHSPLILSDIPAGNVATMDGSPMPQTFASNIVDLYRLNFFLENGTIGAFAAQKLNKVLDKVNGDVNAKLDDDEKLVIQLIGDSRLKQYFMDRTLQ